MSTFTQMFSANGGNPLQFEDREIRPIYRLPVHNGDRIHLRFRSYTASPDQGVRLTVRPRSGVREVNAVLEIDGIASSDFSLWARTAPEVVEIRVSSEYGTEELGIYNVWRHPRLGTMLYGLNNAAIEVVDTGPQRVLLRCSDGVGDPDFSDLVVELERTISRAEE